VSVNARKARGYRTQAVVAENLRLSGIWPFAETAGAGRPGQDILNTPGYAIEVKARRAYKPLEWLRQAFANAKGNVPAVIFRPDGMGETSIDDWGVLMTFRDWKDLVRRAEFPDRDAA
jgi:hypothetical protein